MPRPDDAAAPSKDSAQIPPRRLDLLPFAPQLGPRHPTPSSRLRSHPFLCFPCFYSSLFSAFLCNLPPWIFPLTYQEHPTTQLNFRLTKTMD
uniref:Uncharacterized protein n=1 Tax=Triticum urartu TaxID=4572 RepID=A0A8R7U7L4_TRIUA